MKALENNVEFSIYVGQFINDAYNINAMNKVDMLTSKSELIIFAKNENLILNDALKDIFSSNHTKQISKMSIRYSLKLN